MKKYPLPLLIFILASSTLQGEQSTSPLSVPIGKTGAVLLVEKIRDHTTVNLDYEEDVILGGNGISDLSAGKNGQWAAKAGFRLVAIALTIVNTRGNSELYGIGTNQKKRWWSLLLFQKDDLAHGTAPTVIAFVHPTAENNSLTNPNLAVPVGRALQIWVAWIVPQERHLSDYVVRYSDLKGNEAIPVGLGEIPQ